MSYQIPASLYDGLMHRVPFSVGADFAAKWDALRSDGFTVGVWGAEIFACKIMSGEPLPALAA